MNLSGSERRAAPDAFSPHSERDVGGLSVTRMKYQTAEEMAAVPRVGKSTFWIASLRVSDLERLGLSVVADPLPESASGPARRGHALIPGMKSANRKTDEVLNWKQQLATAVIELHGPFQ